MKIAVIGSGAIGALVAGYLKNSGEDVFLIGRQDSIEAIAKDGLNISGVRGGFRIRIDVFDKLPQRADLTIFAVKTQDVQEAVAGNYKYLKDTTILTTQNGVQADKILARDFAKNSIISSVVMFGSTYLEPSRIVHNFEGKWILGRPYIKNDSKLKEVAIVLNKVFPAEISEDILGMKWLKIFVNANNCLAAIIGKSMQEAFSNLDLCRISMNIWKEGLKVVKSSGVSLVSLPDFPLERLLKLTELPQGESAKIFSGIMINLSKEPLYGSILQSIKRKRSSEIDFINGELVALAEKNRVPAPLNKRLVELVKKVEEERRFLSLNELLENTREFLN